jgi:hypothetical protein
VRAVAATVVIGLLAPLTVATGTRAGAASETPHWDPKVEAVAKQVERLRGFRFKRPVPVVHATRGHFERLFERRARYLLSNRGSKRIYREEIVLRALGVMYSGSSLHELQELDAGNLYAFYDEQNGRIVLRGRADGVVAEVTLVHELAHALQDQEFGAARRRMRLRDTDAILPFDALYEGDATRVATEYVADFSADKRRRLIDAERDAWRQYEPWAVLAESGAPYLFGTQMVGNIQEAGGKRSIDEALRRPPAHQVELVNLSTVPGEFTPVPVTAPKLADGERRIGPTTAIGAMTLYSALASRIDAPTALAAADQWGGSAAVAFIRDGDVCVRAGFRAAAADGTKRLVDALRAWVAAGPEGTSSVVEAGGVATLDACEQVAMSYELGPVEDAIGVLTFRNQVLLIELAQGIERPLASCVADQLIQDPDSVDLVTGIEGGQPAPDQLLALTSRAREVTEDCQKSPT